MGFPFGRRGWHYLVELLREHAARPGLRLEDSILFRFHQRFQPAGMAEALLPAETTTRFRPPLGILPWGSFQSAWSPAAPLAKDWRRSRFCGPSPLEVVRDEFERACAVYESLRASGYDPWRHTFAGGVVLRRRDGALRYVVLQGNHRLAALAFLGVPAVLSRGLAGYHTLIDEREVERWWFVRSGECSAPDARAYLDAYFTSDGRGQARRFGLAEHA
jgi:hypothetical protein